MSQIYAKLDPEETPAIPSLDELAARQTSARAPTKAAASSSSSAPVVVVASYAVHSPSNAEEQQQQVELPASYGRYLVDSCCCGCSLATGTYWIAWLEMASWLMSLTAALFGLYVKSQEKKIDKAIESAQSGEMEMDGEMSPEEQVRETNFLIDTYAAAAPFLIAAALIGLYFCNKGLKASRGCLASAASYYFWKRYTVIFAVVSLLLGLNGGPVGGLLGLAVSTYYALVVRSHYICLLKQSMAAAAQKQAAEPEV